MKKLNMRNWFDSCTTRRLMVAGAACVAALALSVPAHADGRGCGVGFGGGRSTVVISNSYRTVSCPTPVIRTRIVRDCAQLEFERGFIEGKRAGRDVGFHHGISGRAFCSQPTTDFCGASRAFVDGYLTGYAKTYDDAFAQGRCASRARVQCEIRPRVIVCH